MYSIQNPESYLAGWVLDLSFEPFPAAKAWTNPARRGPTSHPFSANAFAIKSNESTLFLHQQVLYAQGMITW